ncbi:MAG TPA: hypothetical protein VFW16_01280 [Streptosporangiaceae bacterium]|nr:hypothetical protein [Streptosporangiaceae bacterium]
MAIADMLPGRLGLGGRLPRRIDDLRGPARGVIMLPRNLSWPGMRECDVSDARGRRSLYGMLLAKGQRNDIARFVNSGLLRQDWPLIKNTLDGRLSRRCERRFGLGKGAAAPQRTDSHARPSGPAAGLGPG